MYLAVVALVMPDLFHATLGHAVTHLMRPLSLLVSVILVVLYALSLLFSVRTHTQLYEGADAVEAELESEGTLPPGGRGRSGSASACCSRPRCAWWWWRSCWSASLEMAIEHWGLTPTFVGVIVIAVVGNAAEHCTAVIMALKNQMDLGVSIAFECSKQIALLVAPVLVLLSVPLGQPMTLEFSHMEVMALALAVGAIDADRAGRRVQLARGVRCCSASTRSSAWSSSSSRDATR